VWDRDHGRAWIARRRCYGLGGAIAQNRRGRVYTNSREFNFPVSGGPDPSATAGIASILVLSIEPFA